VRQDRRIVATVQQRDDPRHGGRECMNDHRQRNRQGRSENQESHNRHHCPNSLNMGQTVEQETRFGVFRSMSAL
jgi:hypothetical protein